MIRNILIIEDEKPNAARLGRLIAILRPQAKILAVLESVCESVQWLQENPSPDLVMMDVRLADGTSFEILEQVIIKCPIIFTTAYDEYAVRAFKFNSVDYLLKPVEEEELEHAFKMAEEKQSGDPVLMENLLANLGRKEYRSRFLLSFRDGFKIVYVSDIEYIYSELKITKAKLLHGNEEVLTQALEELENQLDPNIFFRVNRQFIIHIDAISHIHNYFNGKLKVELRSSPQLEIIVSREKAVALKSWMDF